MPQYEFVFKVTIDSKVCIDADNENIARAKFNEIPIRDVVAIDNVWDDEQWEILEINEYPSINLEDMRKVALEALK